MKVTSFYEPLRFEWSDAEYQATLAVREFSASLADVPNETLQLARQAIEYQRLHSNDDIEEWANRLAKDAAVFND